MSINSGVLIIPKVFLNQSDESEEAAKELTINVAKTDAKTDAKDEPKKSAAVKLVGTKQKVKKQAEAAIEAQKSAAPKEAEAAIVAGQVASADDAVPAEATVQMLAGLATVAAPIARLGYGLWVLMVQDDRGEPWLCSGHYDHGDHHGDWNHRDHHDHHGGDRRPNPPVEAVEVSE